MSSVAMEGGRTVVLIAAVGEVHADDVQADITELVDGLHRVGLGANGADDGSPAEDALGLEGSVEMGQPVDPAAIVEVVESRSGHFDRKLGGRGMDV